MKKFRLLFAAMLFIAITAARLISPDAAGALKDKLLPAIERDVDYREAMVQLGGALSEGRESVVSTLRGAYRAEDTYEPASETPEEAYEAPSLTSLLGDYDHLVREEAVRETVSLEPAAEEPAAEIPEAVAAFLETQQEYAAYEVPANVSYEMPVLPFGYTSPVEGYTSSGFGYRMHPILHEVKFHYGTDFAAWTGTKILAFAEGSVLATGVSDSYGDYIILDHGNGWQTLYSHCSEMYVSFGDKVTKGETIGLVGATGQATGPHLHFELICEDVYYNPEFYLA